MQRMNGQLRFSPTDLTNHVACRHLTSLTLGVATGRLDRPPRYADPRRDAMKEAGEDNYKRVRASYLASRSVETIAKDSTRLRRTHDAMRRGVDVICHGSLESPDGSLLSYPDFLVRVNQSNSDFGPWSYEVVDATMAFHEDAPALMHLLMSSHLLANAQGGPPDSMHHAITDSLHLQSLKVADSAPYYHSVLRHFWHHVRASPATYPEPIRHCQFCRWQSQCRTRWKTDDHLSQIPHITREQRRALAASGIMTVTALAELSVSRQLTNLSENDIHSLQRQAQVGIRGRESRSIVYELVNHGSPDTGLSALPPPNPGDLFLDTNRVLLRENQSLEYLFGLVSRDGIYKGFGALTPAEEKRAIEEIMDIFTRQWKSHPDFHVFVFDSGRAEFSRLKKLTGKYATREFELEFLIRAKVFVNLFQVTRDAIVASVKRYSLHELEPFFAFQRSRSWKQTQPAIAIVHSALRCRRRGWRPQVLHAALKQLQDFNKDNCRAILGLANWLEELRVEFSLQYHEDLSRPSPPLLKQMPALAGETRNTRTHLTSDLPDRGTVRTREQTARALLADLLAFYCRERMGGNDVPVSVLEESIRCTARDVIANGFGGTGASDLLLRLSFCRFDVPSRSEDGGARGGAQVESPADAARRTVAELHQSVLAIQGPPGSGKTRIAAEAILDLLAQGRKVGITAHTHMAISHLLSDVCRIADRRAAETDTPRTGIRGVQKTFDSSAVCPDARIAKTNYYDDVSRRLKANEANLAAGTVWLWARGSMRLSVEVLVVDEAGQMSLPDLVAASRGAKSLFLLGDSCQLPPPLTGSHPNGVAVSGLGHLLGDSPVFEANQGINLETRTWRLPPSICNFVSNRFYKVPFTSHAGVGLQEVRGPTVLAGHGLRFLPVLHHGCTTSSREEVRRVRELVDDLLISENFWIDRYGNRRTIAAKDILVLATYLEQANLMRHCFPAGVRVGTVDSCQGLNAAVVILSLATSGSDGAWPNRVGFSFSRLNAASSCAKCVFALVASPRLLEPACETVGQFSAASDLCYFVEMATVIE